MTQRVVTTKDEQIEVFTGNMKDACRVAVAQALTGVITKKAADRVLKNGGFTNPSDLAAFVEQELTSRRAILDTIFFDITEDDGEDEDADDESDGGSEDEEGRGLRLVSGGPSVSDDPESE